MCQISSLVAATDGPVAEFSSFANFEERKKEIEPFDVISENSPPKGFFWPNKKKIRYFASVGRFSIFSDLRYSIAPVLSNPRESGTFQHLAASTFNKLPVL